MRFLLLFYFSLVIASANSIITLKGSFAFTIPLATKTPIVPSFNAAVTSSPLVIPAPQSKIASGLIFLLYLLFR